MDFHKIPCLPQTHLIPFLVFSVLPIIPATTLQEEKTFTQHLSQTQNTSATKLVPMAVMHSWPTHIYVLQINVVFHVLKKWDD